MCGRYTSIVDRHVHDSERSLELSGSLVKSSLTAWLEINQVPPPHKSEDKCWHDTGGYTSIQKKRAHRAKSRSLTCSEVACLIHPLSDACNPLLTWRYTQACESLVLHVLQVHLQVLRQRRDPELKAGPLLSGGSLLDPPFV